MDLKEWHEWQVLMRCCCAPGLWFSCIMVCTSVVEMCHSIDGNPSKKTNLPLLPYLVMGLDVLNYQEGHPTMFPLE